MVGSCTTCLYRVRDRIVNPNAPWQAEHEIDGEVARRLIEELCPQLAPADLETAGQGWDNTVFRVNRQWVFRFPRRQLGADLLDAEVAILPRVAERVPVSIPVPLWVGRPGEDYPWRFTGGEWIAGESVAVHGPDPGQRLELAQSLGEFLLALHAVSADEATGWGAPGDEIGRLDPELRIPRTRNYLRRAAEAELIDDPHAWDAIIDGFADDAGPAIDPCLQHGDLYTRHLLLDDRCRLTGVIDWGDLHVGDPAMDLSAAWLVLPPQARERFLEVYGVIDPLTWRRARFRAVFHAAVVMVFASETDEPALLGEAKQALEWVK